MEHFPADALLEQINQAERFEELRELRDRMHEGFRELLLFSFNLDQSKLLNRIHDALISRAVAIAERRLEEEGIGRPPVPYAFVLFGSGGRKEQTLWSDQDNGLMYEDPPAGMEELAESYFSALVERLEKGFIQLGYPPCTGNVICTNQRWRKPYASWELMLQEWLDDPHWENVRYLLILADMRPVYGEARLADRLIDTFLGYVDSHPIILEHMLRNTLYHKISLGVFGQLIKERYGEDAGGFDIKYGAYIPIVNGVRLLAVEAGLRTSSSQERIEKLIEGGHIEEELGHEWLEALSQVIKLRSETPFQMEDGQYTTRGKLTGDMLDKERVIQLKFCLRIGRDLQKYVQSKIKDRISSIEKG